MPLKIIFIFNFASKKFYIIKLLRLLLVNYSLFQFKHPSVNYYNYFTIASKNV